MDPKRALGAAPHARPSRRALISHALAVRGVQMGVLGVLCASMGTAQGLGWVNIGSHRASEMAFPTFASAALMGTLALLGLALAPADQRPSLARVVLAGCLGALALAGWGAWLASL